MIGSQEQTERPTLTDVEPQQVKVMRRLWERMTEIYGHGWISAYGVDASNGAGVTWAMGLAGLSGHQLAEGIAACIKSADEWPPKLPQFRAMCLGIPSLAVVRTSMGVTPRPFFVGVVVSYMDMHRFAMADQSTADRMLADAYARAREQVMTGGPISSVPMLTVDQEAAEKRMYDQLHAERMEAMIVERYGSREAWDAEMAQWKDESGK